jgi:hypothetical protein
MMMTGQMAVLSMPSHLQEPVRPFLYCTQRPDIALLFWVGWNMGEGTALGRHSLALFWSR